MKIVQLLTAILASSCVATVALEGAGITVLCANGRLSVTKLRQFAAVVYGVDKQSMDQHLEQISQADDSEQPSFDEIVAQRSLARLDLDLRETAIDKGTVEGTFLQTKLTRDKERYEKLRDEFQSEQEVLTSAAQDEALLEVQRTLTSLPPKQAKDLILRILEKDATVPDRRSLNDLVTMLKSMPMDKRKKIVAEFKTEAEQRSLGDLLTNIRLGVPNVDLIRKTRQQLLQFNPQRMEGSDRGGDSL